MLGHPSSLVMQHGGPCREASQEKGVAARQGQSTAEVRRLEALHPGLSLRCLWGMRTPDGAPQGPWFDLHPPRGARAWDKG